MIFGLSSFWSAQAQTCGQVDVRHDADSLFQAAPSIEDYEDFLSALDFDDDAEDLKEEFQERASEIKELEAIQFESLSLGKRFRLHDRLLKLLLQQATYLKRQTEIDYQQNIRKWRVEQIDGPQPQLTYKDLQTPVLKALGIARVMVRDYEFEEEYALYQLIRLMARTQNQNLFFYFKQFKRQFSKSKYLGHVYHAVGEFHFRQREWAKAESSLKEAMKVKDSPVRPYSVFKLAWVNIMQAQAAKKADDKAANLKKATLALRLTLKLMEDWAHHEPVFQLANQAAIDLAWTMAATRTPRAEVKKLLAHYDQEDAYENYLYYLAIDASPQKEFALADKAFQELIGLDYEARDLPKFYLERGKLYLEARRFDRLEDHYKDFRRILTEDHDWYSEWEDDQDLIKLVGDELAYDLRGKATFLHQEADALKQKSQSQPQGQGQAQTKPKEQVKAQSVAQGQAQQAKQKDPVRDLFQYCRKLYDLYLVWFPGHKSFDDIRYNRALTSFELKDYKRVVDEFKKITLDKSSQYRKDAAYNAVVVALTWDGQQKKPELPPAGQAPAPLALPDTTATLIEQIDRFAQLYPQAQQAVPSLFTAAQAYFEYGHYEKAMERFTAILNKRPSGPEGEASLHQMLSYLVESQQWQKAVKICEKFLKNQAIVAAGHTQIIRQTLDYARSKNKS